jgi:glycosyltransferase involved in cell wall biosynthesis
VWPPNDFAEARHAAHAWQRIRGGEFDVVHVHHAMSLALAEDGMPTVMTLHNARDDRMALYCDRSSDVCFVAISQKHGSAFPELRPMWIHHGLDSSLYPRGEGAGGYAAFLGRLAPEKGPEIAIEAAKRAGVPLRIGGGPAMMAEEHFHEHVSPKLGPDIWWLGEVGHDEKLELLRDARALLFPIRWEEPFGLVMIESMLVGTPVIAFPRGSVPEVVEEGVTGFIVNGPEEMAARLRGIGSFDRSRCRARARARWSSIRMTNDYLSVYARAKGHSAIIPRHADRHSAAE